MQFDEVKRFVCLVPFQSYNIYEQLEKVHEKSSFIRSFVWPSSVLKSSPVGRARVGGHIHISLQFRLVLKLKANSLFSQFCCTTELEVYIWLQWRVEGGADVHAPIKKM